VVFVLDHSGHVQDARFEDFEGDADTREMVLRALSRITLSEVPAEMTGGQPWVVQLHAHAPG
jgi:hypothetical protein